eukprot:6176043-Pleurochrysis_carterae.AAC.1
MSTGAASLDVRGDAGVARAPGLSAPGPHATPPIARAHTLSSKVPSTCRFSQKRSWVLTSGRRGSRDS